MPNPKSPRSGRPLTVGLLVDEIGWSYQWAILQGALDAARDRGANLLCFEGGAFHVGAGASTNLLSLIGTTAVDGLVVLAGALGNEVGPDVMRAICERFRPLPMCFVGLDVPGFSSVSVDNHLGARAVLGHLVVHHGMRRVGFVRGPEANAEAERRFAAYREVLAAASVPFDPALVAPGDFTSDAGHRAVASFLDERARATADLEAIACANDGVAIGVIEALARRGIRVPEQLAVVGFDDVEEARFTTPPLTTVRQPLRRQGREAVRMVLAGAEDENLVLGTELCVRRSCGCFSQRAAAVPPLQPPSLGMEAMIMARRDIMIADLQRAARGAFGAAGTGWEASLVASFTAEISTTRGAVANRPVLPVGVHRPVRSPAAGAGFVETYDDILSRLVAAGIDPAICYDVVATLRRHLLRCVGADRRERALTEDLLEQVSELTGTVMERVQAWQRFDAQRRARVLGRGGAVVTAVLDHGDLVRAASEHLVQLGIESCYLAILDPPDPAEVARAAKLVLAYHAGEGAARAMSYPAGEILPYALLTPGRQVAHVVAEIGAHDDERALLIFDLGQPEGHAYEALRHIFGAALAGVRLGKSLRPERRQTAGVAAARNAVAAAAERCRALSEARGHGDVELGALEGLLQAAQHDLERLLGR